MIIAYSLPVLMFLYPLAITLILLTLFGVCFQNDPIVYRCVTGFTAIAAVADFIRALPDAAKAFLHAGWIVEAADRILPFSKIGFGWIAPAAIGLVVGLILWKIREEKLEQV